MIEYVTGFMFSQDLSHVALIRKLSPCWQKDKFNGIGGKIEIGETAIAAMSREFREETGVLTENREWKLFCILERRGKYKVSFFYSICDKVYDVKTVEKEEVHICDTNQLPNGCIWNLRWLIPLALDRQITLTFPIIIED
ncbi:NUDIX hydrolase [Vibrio campbellii]|uniref:NUDIX hydrolase n=1 Tax=Vibrio campbellii TaxID=680 RepID=UPI000576A79D|nr:NUDIX domain-containing protein [Vibrio campbellii]